MVAGNEGGGEAGRRAQPQRFETICEAPLTSTEASRCSLCLWNDDKHQAARAALAAHESPFRDDGIYPRAAGFITGGPAEGPVCSARTHWRARVSWAGVCLPELVEPVPGEAVGPPGGVHLPGAAPTAARPPWLPLRLQPRRGAGSPQTQGGKAFPSPTGSSGSPIQGWGASGQGETRGPGLDSGLAGQGRGPRPSLKAPEMARAHLAPRSRPPRSLLRARRPQQPRAWCSSEDRQGAGAP